MVTIKEYKAFIKQYKEKNCPKAYSTLKKAPLKKLAEKYGYEGKKEKPKKVYADYVKQYKKENCPPYSNAKKAQLKRISEKMGYVTQPVVKKMKPTKKAPAKPKKIVRMVNNVEVVETEAQAKRRKERLEISDKAMERAERENLPRRELYKRAKSTGWRRPLRTSKTEDLQYWVYVYPAMEEYNSKIKKAPPKPKPEIKKTPEVKLSKPKLTQRERKARKERELFEKQLPLLDALALIWRKADTLINARLKDRYKPEYRRALPLIQNARTSEERQKMYNAWKKTSETLVREIESQLKPLMDAYGEIIKKGEGVLTGNYRAFPSISPRIRTYDRFIRRYLLPSSHLLYW